MEIKFKKNGVVTVGTVDPEQSINLNDPVGTVKGFRFDLLNEQVIMIIEATDGLNTVCREYPIALDSAAWQTFIVNFFVAHIRPLAKAQYDEFKDLVEL